MGTYRINSMYENDVWWADQIMLPDGKAALSIEHIEPLLNEFCLVHMSNNKAFTIQTSWLFRHKARAGSFLIGSYGLAFLMNTVWVLTPEEFIMEYVPMEDWPDKLRWINANRL